MDLICKFCRKIFQRNKVKKNLSTYCSYSCSVEGKKKRTLVNCHICNKIFEKLNKDIVRSNAHYCSRECWHTKRSQNKKECVVCKVEININSEMFSKKFCKVCYIKRFKEKFPEKNNSYNRHKVRIKRNLPLNHPLLRNSNKGESYHTKNGYVFIKKPGYKSSKMKGNYILEHVWVMCEFLGRDLMKHENIHHKNGIRDDNRIENLELWCKGQPAGQRVQDRILFYKEFLEKYDFEVKSKTVTNIFHND